MLWATLVNHVKQYRIYPCRIGRFCSAPANACPRCLTVLTTPACWCTAICRLAQYAEGCPHSDQLLAMVGPGIMLWAPREYELFRLCGRRVREGSLLRTIYSARRWLTRFLWRRWLYLLWESRVTRWSAAASLTGRALTMPARSYSPGSAEGSPLPRSRCQISPSVSYTARWLWLSHTGEGSVPIPDVERRVDRHLVCRRRERVQALHSGRKSSRAADGRRRSPARTDAAPMACFTASGFFFGILRLIQHDDAQRGHAKAFAPRQQQRWRCCADCSPPRRR